MHPKFTHHYATLFAKRGYMKIVLDYDVLKYRKYESFLRKSTRIAKTIW